MNKLNQFLAGLGVIMLSILLEIILSGISDNLKDWGYVTVMAFEWGYICHLQNKNDKPIEL